MNEIPQILEKKEAIIWDGKPKYAPYIISSILGNIIGGGIIFILVNALSKSLTVGLIAGIVAFILAFVWSNLSYKFTHYALSDNRTIFQKGVFGRDFKSIRYDEIKNASVSRGFLNWIFGTGNIRVFTGEMESTGGKNRQIRPKYDSFEYISDSYDVLKELQEHLTEMEENLYGGKNVVQTVKLEK
jgi:uncharacterized membrane protein YdbT with pleckstrin-like domain